VGLVREVAMLVCGVGFMGVGPAGMGVRAKVRAVLQRSARLACAASVVPGVHLDTFASLGDALSLFI
jgi:hypothetical protein